MKHRILSLLIVIAAALTAIAQNDKFRLVGKYSEGLAMVMQDGKCGYIDKDKKIVIPCQYINAGNFSEGLAAVKKDNKWGYIDKTGKVVIPFQFSNAYSFSEGLAAVENEKGWRDEKWGYIDGTGKIVIECRYQKAYSFGADYEGLAEVAGLYGKRFYIDHSGFGYQYGNDINNFIKRQKEQTEEEYNSIRNTTLKDYIAANVIKREVTYDEAAIRQAVEEEINAWQAKGEFEKTADYQARVTEENRNVKIKQLISKYQADLNKQYADAKAEYESNYRRAVYRYCALKVYGFKKQTFTLASYDADNETFMIKTSDYGDILLPVSINWAPEFKDNWHYLEDKVEVTFVPSGDDVALQSVKFGDYVYDSNTKAEYALVDVNYNFKPISFDNLNLAPIATDNAGGGQVAAVTPTVAPKSVAPARKTIEAGSASDVDVNIPKSNRTAANTFAVIIANSKYEHASHVANAENDGRVMEQYLCQTLGVPQTNIYTFHNATYGHITSAVDQLKQIASAFRGEEFNVFFYYVGHGIPNSETLQSYILPVDINPRHINVCYPLRQLYGELGALGANSVTVMVDACFSGANHGDGMLIAEARGVAIKAKEEAPMGNMVVMLAAQEDETAFPYQRQSHGLFTYWILKKLQETKGDVTLGELSDFVTDKVKKTSIIENKKPQTPSTAISPALYDKWRNLRLVR